MIVERRRGDHARNAFGRGRFARARRGGGPFGVFFAMRAVYSRMNKTWVLVAAILGSSMSFIDASAVNVALPIIQRELGATSAQMQWVIEAYALVPLGA